MKIATVCPVWKEVRYLPLVLEQMSLCPGPKLLVWQDKPLYWLGNGDAPSGHKSDVGELLTKFPEIEVMKLEHAPHGDESEEFGGFKWLQQHSYKYLEKRYGTEIVVWMDSDWLFELTDLQTFYKTLTLTPADGKLWSVPTNHYWRDFAQTMATSPTTIAYPISVAHLWQHYKECDMRRLDRPFLYHAAYVLTDAEMYDKVHSWGHAPLFKAREFYEKEWMAHNDTLVDPQLTERQLPTDLLQRLVDAEALLPRDC